jgi:hypothetical protein
MHVLSSCLFETLEAFGRLVNRPDICLNDEWLRRCGTDHLSEPLEGGRAPRGPAPLTASLSQPTGVQTALGVFERADGLFMRPGEIAHGCSFDWGDIDGGEIT